MARAPRRKRGARKVISAKFRIPKAEFRRRRAPLSHGPAIQSARGLAHSPACGTGALALAHSDFGFRASEFIRPSGIRISEFLNMRRLAPCRSLDQFAALLPFAEEIEDRQFQRAIGGQAL